MNGPRVGETWAVRHLLAEGVIRDCHVVAIVDGEPNLFNRAHDTEDDVVYQWAGSDQQHRMGVSNFRRLYVRRVAFAGELRRIGRELRRLAGGDVHLTELAGEIDAQADLLTVGI